jgi:hypothetical protein
MTKLEKQHVEKLHHEVTDCKAELKELRSHLNEMDFTLVTLNVGMMKYMSLFEKIYSFMIEIGKLPLGRKR